MSVENLSGMTLGQYELRDLLGTGGMGAVYLATQKMLERQVVVKVLNVSLTSNPEYLERFRREAKTSAALEHPHIVPVYDYGIQGNISYVVMRLLMGGSLAERLSHSRDTGRPLPSLPETAQIVRQLASALDYAHSQGVIHRDVKTSNVMFDEQGTAFLVDFGIAKLTHATSALTGTGMAMGTPSYMAPEQWRGEEVKPAVDQYSLGVMVYAMLTGRMPFEADTPFALMHKHLNEAPTPIGTFRADLAENVREVVQRTLAKDPEARFETCSDFARAFDRAVNAVTAQPPTGFFVTPLPTRRSPGREITGGMGGTDDSPTTAGNIAAAPAKLDGPTTATGAPVTAEVSAASSNRIVVFTALIVVLVGLAFGAFVMISGQQAAQAQQTQTAERLLALIATDTALAVATQEAQAVQASQTAAVVFAETFTPSATETSTATVTETPTRTLTLDPRAAAQATRDAFLTATATRWTKTPTPDDEATLMAQLTAFYYDDLTATATHWTATPTSTMTASATRTPTATATPSPTSTATPTPIPTATRTPSDTPTIDVRAVAQATRGAILTATAAEWTPTFTPDVSATLEAELTAFHYDDLTATATLWTPTFTATHTLTPTASNTLRPSPTFTVTIQPSDTPMPTQRVMITCPGALPSRLAPGDFGIVNDDDPRPLRVRNGASTTGTVITELIETGESFDVLEGPRCNQDFAWYRIRYRGQQEGWVAEGDSEIYFIAPRTAPVGPTPRAGVDAVLRDNCQLVLEDDFTSVDTSADWFLETTDRFSVEISGGVYVLRINEIAAGGGDPQGENEPALWGSLRGREFTNAGIEAVIRASRFNQQDRARTGLWLRYQGEEAFLAIMIRGDGAYRITRWQDAVYTDLVPWTLTDAIQIGNNVVNTLRVDSSGDEFDLWINGQYLVTVTDATWPSGRVVFWGASTITPASFAMDYFRVCRS